MKTVSSTEAKARLNALLAEVERTGEHIELNAKSHRDKTTWGGSKAGAADYGENHGWRPDQRQAQLAVSAGASRLGVRGSHWMGND